MAEPITGGIILAAIKGAVTALRLIINDPERHLDAGLGHLEAAAKLVTEALNNGDISEARFNEYIQILAE
ncbi:hypothetical protein EW026_g7165 [Hermanssonia centrifuga]|uniref:Uncharacterized protein n=1 Tax=Hermanssonia centrifuga TaxID=98765 RepID=A0A4S4K8W8_9APHY|nr:hypothetical protein EW026_g7165 [Hermanssonia centrifuga]